MPCPFCMIAAACPPSVDPPIINSPFGSAYPVLSTPRFIAFLDIAPLFKGHILLCPREHHVKNSDLSPTDSAGLGFWLPVLSKAVMRAIWGGTEGSWNVVQANGVDAGQTVPHFHCHVIPRGGASSTEVSSITDAERRNIALGEGPRKKLDDEEGINVSKLVKVEITKEIQRLKDVGELVSREDGEELFVKVPNLGLKI